MTYVPTNWQTGDIVSSEKLNKLENKKSEFKIFEASKDGLLEQTSNTIIESIVTDYYTTPGTDARGIAKDLNIGTEISQNEIEELTNAIQYMNENGIAYISFENGGKYPIIGFYYNEDSDLWGLSYMICSVSLVSEYLFNIVLKVEKTNENEYSLIVTITPITLLSTNTENDEENNSGGGK